MTHTSDRPTLEAFAAVLFDMDGTLVDSDAAVERSWRAWAREYGVDEEQVLAVMPGHPAADTVARMRPDLDPADVAAAAAAQLEREYHDLDGVAATPGALDLVAALGRSGRPWAVVTSADARLAGIRLRAAGINAPVVVDRDAVTRGKPDPEGYRLAAARLGVAPRDCLVVEDTATGAAAGRAAGATVAGLKGIDADLSLTDLSDLVPHSSARRTPE
ncbi:HAD-IA family hydrolase [Actinomycetospora sp. TBRC 11914]|uniref:HAD-IA family hydrolase n=1 Tax=Actinomycetospora sp. TBRC 11914 TaxID=2729387 RepID=UPI00145CAB28|nr:HAD-IA family hydrolase [Actinomycetospora sp. TBRC 11914]NMO89955.1 HAD-IA family hydrolase [Actinomycetospora sp. TBRC 11914]